MKSETTSSLQEPASSGNLIEMSECVSASDLEALGSSAVEDYDRRISEIPKSLSVPFNFEAGRLQDKLITLYQVVVMCVRHEEDLEKIASWWEIMGNICDIFAARLHKLHLDHPDCGAGLYYDNILDLKNKCRRLQEMHQ
jgi:hypothetical protein